MVVNPSVTQLFALNIESWNVNLTLGQPHSTMQKRHYGGPPLNPSAKLQVVHKLPIFLGPTGHKAYKTTYLQRHTTKTSLQHLNDVLLIE
jgi:hypothetical protein